VLLPSSLGGASLFKLNGLLGHLSPLAVSVAMIAARSHSVALRRQASARSFMLSKRRDP
jgi:hypothetical protein